MSHRVSPFTRSIRRHSILSEAITFWVRLPRLPQAQLHPRSHKNHRRTIMIIRLVFYNNSYLVSCSGKKHNFENYRLHLWMNVLTWSIRPYSQKRVLWEVPEIVLLYEISVFLLKIILEFKSWINKRIYTSY